MKNVVRHNTVLYPAIWLSIFLAAALLSGCALVTPSIFYPRTRVHGVVVDQNDTPLANVEIRVRKHWPLSRFLYPSPNSTWRIHSDEEGRWRVSARKVDRLFVEALPPEGYKLYTKRLEKAGPFYSGDCPTNTFILRLIKIADEKPPKRDKQGEDDL